jgi:hypothetical protein
MESKVQFVCADKPAANEPTLNIIAAMALYEARAFIECESTSNFDPPVYA